MTKKNWFMTQNNCIVDLNRYVEFYQDADLAIFGILDAGKGETFMGSCLSLEASREYLETIYSQLWDMEYHPVKESDE